MSKKRITSIVLALLMVLTIVSGCKKEEPEKPVESQTDVTSGTDVQSESDAPQEEPLMELEDVVTPELEGYNLLWSDEFNGDHRTGQSINHDIWRFEPHPPRYVNNELQKYTSSEENAFIRNGSLVIKALKTNEYGSDHYSSAKLTTLNKKNFRYGKVCVRAKVPEGKGLWPAIWMMPANQGYGSWPRCGEIDIMEILGDNVGTTYGNLHYGDPHEDQQGVYVLNDGTTFASDFHEFGLEWEPGEFRYYIDGKLFHTINDWFTASYGNEKPFPAPFDVDFYLQLNLAVGGTWPGDPDETTDFNKAEYIVDYVRVYQKEEYDTNVTRSEKELREAADDGNFINNGDFAKTEKLDDGDDWQFMLFNGGEGSAQIADNTLTIVTEKDGTVDYALQLVQANLPFKNGKKYRVSFDAWADEGRDIITCISAPDLNYARYLNDTVVTLTTEKKNYSYEFDMTEKDDSNGRIEFNFGMRGSTATVYLQNVRVEEIG